MTYAPVISDHTREAMRLHRDFLLAQGELRDALIAGWADAITELRANVKEAEDAEARFTSKGHTVKSRA